MGKQGFEARWFCLQSPTGNPTPSGAPQVWGTHLCLPAPLFPNPCNGHGSKRREGMSTAWSKPSGRITPLLYFRKGQPRSSAVLRAGRLWDSGGRGHLPAAVPAMGGMGGWGSARQDVPAAVRGCFPTPPFVQTHPRCHGEGHPLPSRVTATTLLGPEPAQPKGRLVLPEQVGLCGLCASGKASCTAPSLPPCGSSQGGKTRAHGASPRASPCLLRHSGRGACGLPWLQSKRLCFQAL